MQPTRNRIWEIDLLRGIALLLMIYFHVIYDMDEIFKFSGVSYSGPVNYYTGKASGTLFIFTAGVSSFLSRGNVKRALRILGIAMLITLVSYLYDPGLMITFGILHFLGTSILISTLLHRCNPIVFLGGGTGLIVLGSVLPGITVQHNWYFPLGFSTGQMISSDYYPLIPWFGVFLYGMAAGKFFYQGKKSLFSFNLRENIISRAGRNTLLLYLIHQPVIMAVLALVKRFA